MEKLKFIKIVIIYGVLGGLIIIFIHFLGSKIYYIAGLLFPFAFIISMWSAFKYTYRSLNYFNFNLYYRIGISVFFVMYLINIVYIYLTNSILGELKDNIIAYLFILFFGLLFSFIITSVFKFLVIKRRTGKG